MCTMYCGRISRFPTLPTEPESSGSPFSTIGIVPMRLKKTSNVLFTFKKCQRFYRNDGHGTLHLI